MKRLARGVFISLAALLLVSACARPVGKMAHDMDTMIQNASTKADHEALATHYEQEVKALQGKAADHRRMAEAYAKNGYIKTKTNLVQHCNLLTSKYQEAASEYSELAKQHRQLAAEGPK